MKSILKVPVVGVAFACSTAFAQPVDGNGEVCPCDDMWELAIAWSNYAVRGVLN